MHHRFSEICFLFIEYTAFYQYLVSSSLPSINTIQNDFSRGIDEIEGGGKRIVQSRKSSPRYGPTLDCFHLSIHPIDRQTAIPKYRQAAKITPQDPAPLGNISAAIFEIGKYESCISFAERALALHKKNVDCDAVSSLAQMNQVKKLEARVQKAKMLVKNVGDAEEKKTRMRILKEVGRYRPTM